MVDDILIGLVTAAFVVLVLLVGSLMFEEEDNTWGHRK